MRIFLKVWRQAGPKATGELVDYTVEDVSPDISFLEMLDVVNEGLIRGDKTPLPSIRTAVKAFAAPAAFWWTEFRMALNPARRCASCICGGFATRPIDSGAMACEGVPGDQRPGRGPKRV